MKLSERLLDRSFDIMLDQGHEVWAARWRWHASRALGRIGL